MYSSFNILTTGPADTICFRCTWSQSVKKANFAWFPVHRVYIKVGILIAQCALSTLPVWMDLTSPEFPGLSTGVWSVILKIDQYSILTCALS